MHRYATTLLACLLGGCEQFAPPRPVSDVSISISALEYTGEHHWVVVGQTATASVGAASLDCVYEPPCNLPADVEVTSSDPDVLGLDRRLVESPGTVVLRARAVGTATVTARLGNLSASRSVTVVAAPLLIDDLRVGLVREWLDLPAEYESSGNLLAVTVPTGQSGVLQVDAIRGGEVVLGIPIEVGSSNPASALPTVSCRPEDVDPGCDVAGSAWVTGISPGDAEITITVRNLSRRFTAHVAD